MKARVPSEVLTYLIAFLKVLFYACIGVFVLLMVSYLAIQLPISQNYLTNKTEKYLSEQLDTKVSVHAIEMALPKSIVVKEFYLEDQHQDTLIYLGKLALDIDPFYLLKHQVKINSLVIEDLACSVNRASTDSVFNYDFITQSINKNSDPNNDPAVESSWGFIIDELQLEGIRFDYQDFKDSIMLSTDVAQFEVQLNGYELSTILPASAIKLTGIETQLHTKNEHLTVSLHHNTVNINELNLTESKIDIQALALNNGFIQFEKIKSHTTDTINTSTNTTNTPWNILCSKALLDKISFKYNDQTIATKEHGFDPAHVEISGFTSSMSDLHFSDSIISMTLESLKAEEKKDFSIQNASGTFQFSEKQLNITNFLLTTPHSQILTDVSLNYQGTEELFALSENIGIHSTLRESNIGSADLLYFLPHLTEADLPLQKLNDLSLYALIEGTVREVNIRDLTVFDKKKKAIKLSGPIFGLPKIETANFDLRANVYNPVFRSVTSLYPGIITNIELPKRIELVSKLSGRISDFQFENKLISDHGTIRVDGDYFNEGLAKYQINTSLVNCDLGYILKNSDLGVINMKAKLEGAGVNLDKLAATLESKIETFDFKGHQYQDLQLSSSIKDKLGNLKVNSANENLHFDLVSSVDLKDPLIHTKLDLDIKQGDLKSTGITSLAIQTKGSLAVDIIGSSWDSLQVSLETQDFKVTRDDVDYTVSPSVIHASLSSSSTALNLNTPFLDAHFSTNFAWQQLENVIMNNVLPSILSNDSSSNKNANQLEFAISNLDPKVIKTLLIPELDDLELKTFQGTYSGSSEALHMIIDIPHFTYKDISMDSLVFLAQSDNSGFNFTGNLHELRKSDFVTQAIAVRGSATDKETLVSVDFIDSVYVKPLSLTARIDVIDSGYVVLLIQDSLIIGYDSWQIDKRNQLMLTNTGFNFQNFVFHNNQKTISLQSENEEINAPLHLNFQQFELSNFSNLINSSDLNFNGSLDGKVVLIDPNSNFGFESDFTISDFSHLGDTIGNIRLLAENKVQDLYDLFLSVDGNNTSLMGTGFYISESDLLNMNLQLEEFNLSSVEKYADDFIVNLDGNLTGSLNLQGALTSPSITGQLNFKNTSFNTKYLGSYFLLKDETIHFRDYQILFSHFNIDDANGNSALIDGFTRYDQGLYYFNLDLITHKFQLLNTKPTGDKNEQFFGQLMVNSNLKIRGSSVKPQVEANVKIIEGSELTIVVPESSLETIESDGVVQFVSKANPQKQTDSTLTNKSELIGIQLHANLEIVPEVKLKILMDREAGDYLEVRGKSSLSYSVDPNGETNLSGTYEVAEGTYELTYYNFVKKQFTIDKGSQIKWVGNPYNALFDGRASYLVNTSPLPLIESQLMSSDQSAITPYKQILPFIINLDIGGNVSNPQIHFGIEMPADKQNFQGGIIANKIQQLNTQESELNKQAFSLLLFNRFLPENSFSGGASGALTSTARNSVSKLLTEQLNSLSGKYIKGVKINMDVESFEDYSSGASHGRTDLKLELSKELFSDKLVVTVGSNVVLEGEQKQNGIRNLAQDVELEYKLGEDGTYRLKAFRNNQYEGVIDGELIKTGVGISLSKEFDTWEDFFKELKSINPQ